MAVASERHVGETLQGVGLIPGNNQDHSTSHLVEGEHTEDTATQVSGGPSRMTILHARG